MEVVQENEVGAKETKRLVIIKMVLENFKSYAGEKEIGPFQKRFTAIVGPNGSGKSNVIDALLFVCGKNAKKMRQNKVGELIHNSAEFPNCTECSVSIHFQDIIDDESSDDAFTVVPNSQLVVRRVAYKNNTSKYYVDNKLQTRNEVIELLKRRGIDLDHNRFLILQGEVEQISLMKPKAETEHDEGLLEYIEDMIGSNRLVADIEETNKEVEKFNEERNSVLNRVKVAEKEVAALEGSKCEAESYLSKEKELSEQQGVLYQLYVFEANKNKSEAQEKKEELTSKLNHENEKLAKFEEERIALEGEHNLVLEDYNKINDELVSAKNSFAAYERKDVKYRVDIKDKQTRSKELKKTIESETKKAATLLKNAEEMTSNIPQIDLDIEKKGKELEVSEAKLEKVEASLKGETTIFRSELEKKQKEIEPLSVKLNEAKSVYDTCETEINLITSRSSEAVIKLQETKTKLASIQENINNNEFVNSEKEIKEKKARLQESNNELVDAERAEESVLKEIAQHKGLLAESRADAKQSSNVSNMLVKLKEAAQKGGALAGAGFHGRLGDLGSIAKEYDVAISTACGALDHLVVETAEGAQQCVEYLKKYNLGRATFIILEKVSHLSSKIASEVKTPSGTPRLFDLIKMKEEKFATAFYYGVQNTLVSNSLEEASKIAYVDDKVKWRVVTIQGQLIDTSGTMSGGGNKVKSGGMKSSLAKTVAPQDLVDAERELKNLEGKLVIIRGNIKKLNAEIQSLNKEINKLELERSKAIMVKEAHEKQIPELINVIKALEGETSMSKDEEKKVKELSASLSSYKKDMESLTKAHGIVEQAIAKLQSSIMEIGGEKLINAKKEVDKLNNEIVSLKTLLSKTKVELKNAHKKHEAAIQAAKNAAENLEETNKSKTTLMEEFKVMEEEALKVNLIFTDLQAQLKEKEVGLNESKEVVDEKLKYIQKIKKTQIDIINAVEDCSKVFAENEKKEKFWKAKFKTLKKKYDDEYMSVEVEEEVKKVEDVVDNSNNDSGKAGEVKEKNAEEMVKDEEKEEGKDEDELKENNEKMGEETPAIEKKEEVKKNELKEFSDDKLKSFDKEKVEYAITLLEEERDQLKDSVNMGAIAEYKAKEITYKKRLTELDGVTELRDTARRKYENLRKTRLDEFMSGFSTITLRLKEMYQMITLGGDAELELVDSLDPFSEGIVFSVRPPKKSWKNISNLSGGEKTLSSLALVFALHHYKPTPLYVMDEIDAALDFKNVSIVANYIKERTKNAQFIIISLRNNMFEVADRLVGIYKTNNATKSVTINPKSFLLGHKEDQSKILGDKTNLS